MKVTMFSYSSSIILVLCVTSQLALADTCNDVQFRRLSRTNVASLLGSVEHIISVASSQPDKNTGSVSTSCWVIFNWGKGCTWGRAETSDAGKGWGIEHEAYDVYNDYNGQITIHGNGCDGTVLQCRGTHTHYTIPAPDPNSPPQTIYMSDSNCAANLDALKADGGPDGSVPPSLVDDTPNTKRRRRIQPAPYYCQRIEGEGRCADAWKCEDPAASITQFFPATASFETTMTSVPTVAPIEPCQ